MNQDKRVEIVSPSATFGSMLAGVTIGAAAVYFSQPDNRTRLKNLFTTLKHNLYRAAEQTKSETEEVVEKGKNIVEEVKHTDILD